MWRVNLLIAQLVFSSCNSLSIKAQPSPIHISPNETAAICISEVFSGSLLTFEVRGTEAAAVSLEPNLSIRELRRSALSQPGLRVGAAFHTRAGTLAVLHSKRTIEVWEVGELAMKKIEELTTERDIADIKGLHGINSPALLYWTVAESEEAWNVFYVNLSDYPLQPSEILAEVVIPLTSKLIVCSEQANLFVIREGKSASHQSITRYSFSFFPDLQEAEDSFSSGPILDLACPNVLILLAAEGVYVEMELMFRLSTLPIEFGKAEKLGQAFPWAIFTTTGMIASKGSYTVKFYPGVKYELRNSDANSASVLISECGTTYCAVITNGTGSHQTSFMVEIVNPWNFDNFQIISTYSYKDELSHYTLVSIIDKEIVLLEVTLTSDIYITVANVQDSLTFECCAVEHYLHSQQLCTAVAVKVSAADIIVKSEEPVLLQCHLTSPRCEYQISRWIIGPNLQFVAGDSQITISGRFGVSESELEEGSLDALLLGPLCISEGIARLVTSSGLTVTLHNLKRSETVTQTVFAEAVSCVFQGTTAYVLLRNNEVLIINGLNSARYWSPPTNATLSMKSSIASLFLLAGSDLIEMDSETMKTSIHLMSDVINIFSSLNLLLVLTQGEVNVYVERKGLKYQHFARWSVDESVVAVAYINSLLYTYNSAGILSIYLAVSLAPKTLLHQVDMAQTCTFQQFWIKDNGVLVVCEELIQLVAFSTSKECLIAAVETGQKALVNLSTSITVLVNHSNHLLLRKWGLEDTHPSLTVLVPSSSVHDPLTFSSAIVVKSSSGASQTVPIIVTARNAGGLVIPNQTWENAVLAVSEERTLSLWELFSGYNLNFSVTPESTRAYITPSCNVVQSIPLPAACAISLSTQHNLFFCITFARIAVYAYECVADTCSTRIIAAFQKTQYEFEYFLDMKILSELRFTILVIVTGYDQLEKHPLTRKQMLADYNIEEKSLKILYIETALSSPSLLFFVTESEALHHLFIYGQDLSHYAISEGGKGKMTVEKRIYRELRLVSISSMSSIRKQGEIQVFMLTMDDELFTFRLKGTISLVSKRTVSFCNYRSFLHGTTIVCIGWTMMRIYSIFEQRLISEVYLPPSAQLTTRLQLSPFEKAVVVINALQQKKLIIDLQVRPDSSALCYFPSDSIGFTPSGVYGIQGKFLEILSISTPTLHITSGDFALKITAQNDAGQQAILTVNVMRATDRKLVALVGTAVLFAVGAGYCWFRRRRMRKTKEKISEIELETSS